MKIYKLILSLFIIGLCITSCKKDNFVKVNIDPNTLYSIDPAAEFLEAAAGSQSDFEYFYDVYRATNLWMQYTTVGSGNSPNFTNVTGNFNYRYGVFYGKVGRDLTDIPVLISKLSADQQAKKQYIKSIAAIFKAYYAFYVSDINGSIPYTEAFVGRYGGTLTPKYDAQQDLFDTLDTQIKNAVKTLETPQGASQDSLGANDPFFGGNANSITQWIKSGNALRLKIGMRLMKRSPAKLQAIAAEVLADGNQMGGVEDTWMLAVGPQYANATGNFNPTGFAASKPMIDFLSSKNDPRLRIYYRPNKDGVYLGSFPSPDDALLPANNALYHTQDTLSSLQYRLFTPNYDYGDGNGPGAGVGFFPFITYAEYCFIRAELGARSITGDDAATWYNNGVTASIQFYNERAIAAQIPAYVAVTQTEIDDYLAETDIAFDPSKAVEQIACQAYLDFFRQPTEAWAWWKRTGFPTTTSVVAWSPLMSNGALTVPPRRAPLTLSLPTYSNYANQKAAYDAMAADPGFGTGPSDGFGRVWWDQQ